MAWNWGISIITFAFGLGLGFALAYLIIPRSGRIHELEKELDEAKSAQTEYRSKVNQHFQKTAELFEEMTDKYRAVYQHMASSAQNLCEERPESLALEINTRGRLGNDGKASQQPEEKTVNPAAPAEAGKQPPTAADSDRDEHDDVYGDAPRVPEVKVEEKPRSKDHQTAQAN